MADEGSSSGEEGEGEGELSGEKAKARGEKSFSSELGLYKIFFPAIGQSFQAPPSRVVVALVGRKRTAPERFLDYRQSKLKLKK